MTDDTSKKDTREIEPPWVKYPSYESGDGFWRQTGESWLTYVWRPYWDGLTPEEQEAYLSRWNVPDDWRLYYFDSAYTRWLDTVDDE